MVSINLSTTCAAPIDVTYGVVDNVGEAHRWMFGVTDVLPVTSGPHGVGSEYDANFTYRAIRLTTRVRVVERIENSLIVTESIAGFAVRSVWRFANSDPSTTLVEATLDYELPGGLAGRALGKALGPVVALTLQRTDQNLRRVVGEQSGGSRSRE